MDFNKLWNNFLDTIQNHYMDFAGRMGRTQYWYFVLVLVVVGIAVGIVGGILASIFYLGGIAGPVYMLATVLPLGGMSARRMQDTGRNGQLAWIWVGLTALNALLQLKAILFPPVGYYYGYWGMGYGGGLGALGALIGLATLVVSLAIIWFCAQPGESGPNAYGPPPAPWSPN